MSDEATEAEQMDEQDYSQIITRYFEKYTGFFPNKVSRAVFLEGVLVGFLLQTQRMHSSDRTSNEPFWNSLHGLRVDKRILLDLFPRTVNKLKVLGRSYSSLARECSRYLQEAGMEWTLTPLELSWYFTHGIASYQHFRRSKDQ